MGYIHSCTQREKNKYIFPKQKHKLFTMKRRELNDLKVEGQKNGYTHARSGSLGETGNVK